MEARHGSLRAVRKFQYGVPELEVGDPRPCRHRLLEVVLEPEMSLIECDGSLKISHMKGYMVDLLVHRRRPSVLGSRTPERPDCPPLAVAAR